MTRGNRQKQSPRNQSKGGGVCTVSALGKGETGEETIQGARRFFHKIRGNSSHGGQWRKRGHQKRSSRREKAQKRICFRNTSGSSKGVKSTTCKSKLGQRKLNSVNPFWNVIRPDNTELAPSCRIQMVFDYKSVFLKRGGAIIGGGVRVKGGFNHAAKVSTRKWGGGNDLKKGPSFVLMPPETQIRRWNSAVQTRSSVANTITHGSKDKVRGLGRH